MIASKKDKPPTSSVIEVWGLSIKGVAAPFEDGATAVTAAVYSDSQPSAKRTTYLLMSKVQYHTLSTMYYTNYFLSYLRGL